MMALNVECVCHPSVNRGGRPGPVRGTWTSPGRPAAVRSTVFAGPDVPETSPVLRRLGRCRAIPLDVSRTDDGRPADVRGALLKDGFQMGV